MKGWIQFGIVLAGVSLVLAVSVLWWYDHNAPLNRPEWPDSLWVERRAGNFEAIDNDAWGDVWLFPSGSPSHEYLLDSLREGGRRATICRCAPMELCRPVSSWLTNGDYGVVSNDREYVAISGTRVVGGRTLVRLRRGP